MATDEQRVKALKWTNVKDIWGIGRRHAKRLEAQGVKTAYDFSNLPDSWIRKHMSVLELRLKKDLLGLPYIQLDDQPSAKKSIATTRSFQNNLREFWEIEERITTYATSCAEKLRQQKSSCTALMVCAQQPPQSRERALPQQLCGDPPLCYRLEYHPSQIRHFWLKRHL